MSAIPDERGVLVRGAVPSDSGLLLEMFTELAEYEDLMDQLQASEELIAAALFGERPAAEALIAEHEGNTAGYAVFFPTFSSFLSKQGIWLEDIYVRPDHRRAGIGGALLAVVAQRLLERGGRRLEWSALDWNERALGFYRSIGAQTMDQWITHRLVGEPLQALAARAPAVADPPAGS